MSFDPSVDDYQSDWWAVRAGSQAAVLDALGLEVRTDVLADHGPARVLPERRGWVVMHVWDPDAVLMQADEASSRMKGEVVHFSGCTVTNRYYWARWDNGRDVRSVETEATDIDGAAVVVRALGEPAPVEVDQNVRVGARFTARKFLVIASGLTVPPHQLDRLPGEDASPVHAQWR